jgi:CRP-like cAMP-binding protein
VSTTEADVERTLRERRAEVQRVVATKQEELRPLEIELIRIDRALREYTAGAKTSIDIGDEQIITWVRCNAHGRDRRTAKDIAAAFGGDGRGFSRRLPRMVRQGLLRGDPRSGYYAT